MKIIVTGDLHGEYSRFDLLMREGAETLSADDILIVCGDFGFVFLNNEREKRILDMIAQRPYTIAFCDGNHEDFAALNALPVEFWNGGKIHKIRKNIIHLMRGQVYTIGGKRFFTFGGAYSIDRYMRQLNYSYWNEELPNNSEYQEAADNLKKVGYHVDYIISHTAPREIIRRMGHEPDPHDMELTGFLEWVMYETSFGRWFFGHWHTDKEIDDKFRAIYFDYVTIGE